MRASFKKIVCLGLLGFFFLIPSAYSQVATDNIYEISDFSKLLYSQVSPYLIPPNAAVEARNLRANQVVGALNKRDDMLSAGSAGNFAITSIHRYYKSDDTKYLIVTGSTFIEADDDDDGVYFGRVDDSLNLQGEQFAHILNLIAVTFEILLAAATTVILHRKS